MGCSDHNSSADALADFGGQAAMDAITCPYSAGYGLGLEATFLMFVLGFIGLGMTIRVRHPGPILVSGILTAGVFATQLPGIVAKIFALVLVVGIAAAGLYIYQRAQSSL